MKLERAVAILNEQNHREYKEWNIYPPGVYYRPHDILVCGPCFTDGRLVFLFGFEAVAIAREYIRRDRLRTRARARRKKALRTAHESP